MFPKKSMHLLLGFCSNKNQDLEPVSAMYMCPLHLCMFIHILTDKLPCQTLGLTGVAATLELCGLGVSCPEVQFLQSGLLQTLEWCAVTRKAHCEQAAGRMVTQPHW